MDPEAEEEGEERAVLGVEEARKSVAGEVIDNDRGSVECIYEG